MPNKSMPTVLTLDAGGTNFVFSAIKDFKEIVSPTTLPAHSDDLEKCLSQIIEGFQHVAREVGSFEAISFAFPGPADYELGIIGDLPNFPAFNGGVPLGPMLRERFSVPVFINNDGNLFAAGVARAGYLPALNRRLREAGSRKQFRNLIGITLGTGFGCGIVCNGQTIVGDNSSGAEIHNTLNPYRSAWNAEESVSTRAILRVYAEHSGVNAHGRLMPRDIYEIATGVRDGDAQAARTSFEEFGKALGGSIANVLSLIDGIVVIGGGLSRAWDLFAPSMFHEVNREMENPKGQSIKRLSFKVFNLEDPNVFEDFARGQIETVIVPKSNTKIEYDALQRSGIALSDLDSSLAISLGAYAFALQQLESKYNV